MGEPVRDDGPILGVDFDPLPPGAFGTPIVKTKMEQEQQRQSGWPFEANLCEQSSANSNKHVSRTPHDYHFLPAQLTTRTKNCERVVPTYHCGSPDNVGNDRTSPDRTSSDKASSDRTSPDRTSWDKTSSDRTSPDRKSSDGTSSERTSSDGSSSDRTSSDVTSSDETAVSHYALQRQRQMRELNTLSQQGRQDPLLSSPPAYRDNFLLQNSAINISIQPHYRLRSSHQTNNQKIISVHGVIHDEKPARLERKRMSKEVRIEQELEAQEKRVRKEIEKRDRLMRKREEQRRKKLEILNCEKQKEEEILLRERQHEEICRREQKCELERRGKLLQKESLIPEKMRQKEELSRENEASHTKAADEREIAHRNLTILASILLGEDK